MPWAVATASMPVYAGSLWWSVDEEPSLKEIPLPKLRVRVVTAADGDHGQGQVDADWGHALAGWPGRNVPGAASQIGDRRADAGLLGEAGQQGPVERLVSQLVAEAVPYCSATVS